MVKIIMSGENYDRSKTGFEKAEDGVGEEKKDREVLYRVLEAANLLVRAPVVAHLWGPRGFLGAEKMDRRT